MSIISVDTINPRQSGVAVTVTGQCDVGVAITMDGTAGVITATAIYATTIGDSNTTFAGNGSALTGMASTEYIDAASVTSSGIVTISNTTASTSTSTGALIVSGGVGIAGSMFVGENVSIGGTLTYEDVTNIDSVGVVTARLGVIATAGRGIQVTAGGVNVDAGIGTFDAGVKVAGGEFTVGSGVTVGTAGVSTFSNGVNLAPGTGLLREKVSSTTSAWSSSGDLNLDNGMVQYTSGNLGGTNNTLNITSSVGINTQMAVGEMIIVTGITSCSSSSAFVNALKIDHTTVQVAWVGGSAPSDGGGSGFDTYTFNIWKTASATYNVIGNQVKTS